MKPFLVVTLLLFAAAPAFGQTSSKASDASGSKKTVVSEDKKFTDYCLKNALQVITVPEGKSTDNLAVAGEVTLLGNEATYRDYGIALKENETQYYRIAGSAQLLKVSSVYRLRIAYNAEKH